MSYKVNKIFTSSGKSPGAITINDSGTSLKDLKAVKAVYVGSTLVYGTLGDSGLDISVFPIATATVTGSLGIYYRVTTYQVAESVSLTSGDYLYYKKQGSSGDVVSNTTSVTFAKGSTYFIFVPHGKTLLFKDSEGQGTITANSNGSTTYNNIEGDSLNVSNLRMFTVTLGNTNYFKTFNYVETPGVTQDPRGVESYTVNSSSVSHTYIIDKSTFSGTLGLSITTSDTYEKAGCVVVYESDLIYSDNPSGAPYQTTLYNNTSKEFICAGYTFKVLPTYLLII